MTYYLLATCILSLVFVYVIYLTGKNVPDKVNYPIVFTPSILSGIILLFSFTVTTPIDTRKAEYTAQSIKHYPEWIEEIEVNDTSSVRIKHREYYTMFYKTTTGTGEFEIPRWTYNYFSELYPYLKKYLNPSIDVEDRIFSFGILAEVFRYDSKIILFSTL